MRDESQVAVTDVAANENLTTVVDKKAARKARVEAERVGVGKFWAWQTRGVSVAANAIVFGFTMIFCTDTLGLNPATLGVLFMVAKVFDALGDLAACWLVDNTRTKWGKGRPYEWAVLGLWLTTILIFFTPTDWSDMAKYAWVIVFYILQGAVFQTLLDVNATPYMIRAFGESRPKLAKVSSLGAVVIMIGAVIVGILFPIGVAALAGNPETGYSSQGWFTLSLAFGVPLAILGMLRFAFVKEDPTVDLAAGDSGVRIRDIVASLRQNRYVWVYAGFLGAQAMATGLMGVGTYYFTWVVGSVALMSVVSFVSILALPAMFAFPALLRRMSASHLSLIGAGVAAVGAILMFFAGASLPLIVVATMLMSVGQFPVMYLGSLFVMQLADYNEYRGLPRMDASVSLVPRIAYQIGTAAAAGGIGIALGIAGYVGTAATQSPEAMFSIRALYSLAPLVFILLMGIMVRKMSPLDKLGPQIDATLAEKREAVKADLVGESV